MTASECVYDAVLIKFICRKCLTSFHLVMFIFVFYATAFLSWYGNIVKRSLQKNTNKFEKVLHAYAGRKSHACHACLLRKLENYAHYCADTDKADRMKSLCVLEAVAQIPDYRNEYQSLQA